MRRCGVALAAALALPSCGSDGAASPFPTDASPVAVTVQRERLFETRRAFELRFEHDGAVPLEVTDARLVTDLFAPVEPDPRVVIVHPGVPVTMPLAHGSARCDAEEPDASIRVALTVDAEATEADAGEAEAAILRVHAAECAAAEVADAVAIGFGDRWEHVTPGRVEGQITVDPRGDQEVVVEQIDASVVFSLQVQSSLPASDDVEVVITAARCDAHVLTESKKTYHFPVVVRVGDADPVRIELVAADGAARTALDRAITECVAAEHR